MKILALEFSSHRRSVAVAHVAEDGATEVLGSAGDAAFRGVTGLMLIDRALTEGRVRRSDIESIAVGLGPGSYAGIRSAIALAQGWQLGREVKVVGISSTHCLAEEARRRGSSGEITLIVDAQRGDVYIQKFRLGSKGCGEIEPLRIVPSSSIPTKETVVGPEAARFVPGGIDLCPSAATLSTLFNVGLARPAEQLEPVYLRETTFVKAPPSRHIG
jgi:tRNA threonylcarbamoyladenosine biosynthesis protein TsaB